MQKIGTTESAYQAVLDTIVIERGSGTPQYQQLYRQLKGMILRRALRTGMRLPSTRALAADLGIARNTIIQVYEQLETEGYIETAHGALARIADLPTISPDNRREEMPAMAQSLSSRGRNLTRLDHRSGQPDTVMFQPGMPDMQEFPFVIWRRLITRHLKPSSFELYGYYSYNGYLPLREAIASYVEASRGVRCVADQILITSGAQCAMNLIACLLTDPGDEVLVEEPGYTGMQGALLAAGTKLLPLRVDGGGWRLNEAMENRPKLIYLTPSCQFPIGITMRMEQRLRVIDFAHRTGAWIVEDDFDSEYRFSSKPIPAMQGADEDGRTIYVGTFSKTLFPALRLGFIVFPGTIETDLSKASFLLGNTPPLLLQAALADFIGEGHFAKHLRRMRRIYDGRRYTFMKLARPLLDEWLEPLDGGSGLQTVWRARHPMDDVKLAKVAEKSGLNVTPLSSHYLHDDPEPGLILGYALMKEIDMKRCLDKLCQILRADLQI